MRACTIGLVLTCLRTIIGRRPERSIGGRYWVSECELINLVVYTRAIEGKQSIIEYTHTQRDYRGVSGHSQSAGVSIGTITCKETTALNPQQHTLHTIVNMHAPSHFHHSSHSLIPVILL